MSRRHAKEFRPDEALSLISADREGRSICCPSCGSNSVDRTPPRADDRTITPTLSRVQLVCGGCGRLVAYIDREARTG